MFEIGGVQGEGSGMLDELKATVDHLQQMDPRSAGLADTVEIGRAHV